MERRKLTRVLWFWVVFVTIAAYSNRALCQDPHDNVLNLPYTAQVVQTYTETEPDGTRVRRQEKLVRNARFSGKNAHRNAGCQ